ncbi:MAG: hypothetical protein ACTSQ9_08015, partial [Candidatus Hodarchaeales archaeon]
DFDFEIIGYNGTAGVVGIPLPPDFNDTPIPEGDMYSYDQLIFCITYRGTTSRCTITKILLWQEWPYFEYEYNYTVKEVDPPGYSLKKDQSYEFLVDSGPWPHNFHIHSPITIRLYTENQGDILLSIQISYGISELKNWKPQNPSLISVGSILSLIITLTIVIGIKRRVLKKNS